MHTSQNIISYSATRTYCYVTVGVAVNVPCCIFLQQEENCKDKIMGLFQRKKGSLVQKLGINVSETKELLR